jgi:outer membrane protein OmpA-like peptidoglycan-associated protein
MRFVSTFLLACMLLAMSCSSTNKNTIAGAGIGTAVGAGVGAIFGKEKGALIGAAVGGSLGAYAGHRMDKQAAELRKIAETKRTEQGLVTKLKSDILFDTGKADLKPKAKANLKQMAMIMKKYPENVLTVKGYTDSTGSAAINERLSAQRAEAVRRELAVAGLPVQALTAIGLGDSNPLADNSSESGRSQNRRVEIEITVDESKIPKNKKSKS